MTKTTTTGRHLESLFLRYRDEGDPGALGELFDATAPGLFRLAVTLAPDAATAEDALQETFLAAMRHADSYDADRPLLPWLCTILMRRVEDARRRAGRVPDPLRLVPPLGPEDPCHGAERREDVERIRRAIDALPEPYRTVGLLRWRYGLEPAQIAEVRRVPPGTVRSLLSRALARLRRDLGALPMLLLLRGGRPGRGLEAVRREVLQRAVRRGVGAGGAVVANLWLGGVLVGKKSVAGVLAVLILAAVGFLALRSEEGNGNPVGVVADAGHTASPLPGGVSPVAPDAAPAPPSLPAAEGAQPVRGHVVDRDGRPVSGARVFTIPDDVEEGLVNLGGAGSEGSRVRTVMADSDGGFEVPVEGGAPFYALVAEAPGYARTERRDIRSGTEDLVLVLDRPAVIVGFVRSTTGAPIPGASVRVNGYTAAGVPFDVSTKSGEDGSYRLDGVPPHHLNYFSLSRQRLWLEARAEGFAPLILAGRMPLEESQLPDLDPGTVAHQDLWLSRGVTMRGRVLDFRTRSPVAGAEVVALSTEGWGLRTITLPSGGTSSGGGQEFRPLGRTVSGTDGSFALDHLPCNGFHRSESVASGGSYGYVAAWKRGWSFSFVGIRAAEDGESLEADILLSPAATVEGRVVDSRGEPVPGAMVQATTEEARFPGQGTLQMFFPEIRGFPANWAVADPEGRYRMEGVVLRDGAPAEVIVQGRYPPSLRAFGTGFDGRTTLTASPGVVSAAPDLVLGSPSTWAEVRFLVTDPQGRPVRGATFRAGQRYDLEEFRIAQYASIRTGSDGCGRFLFDFGEQQPFEVAVDVFAPGFASAREFVVPDAGAPPEATVVLQPGHRLVGRVLAANGSPDPGAWVSVASAAVSVSDAFPDDQFVGARSSDAGRFLLGYAPVESDGTFAVEDLPSGPWHVAATSFRRHTGPGDSRILRTVLRAVEEGATDLVLRLPADAPPAGSSFTCRVTDAVTGVPIPRCYAALYGPDNRRIDGRPLEPGVVRFENVPTGIWDLSAAARNHSPGFIRGLEVREGLPAAPLTIELSQGAMVSGSVLDTAGRSAGFVDLVFTPLPGSPPSARGVSLPLDSQSGTYRIGGFQPGRYGLEVRPKVAGRPVMNPVNGEVLQVSDGDREVKFDVVVAPHATLEVVVTDPRLPSMQGTGGAAPPEKVAFGAAARVAIVDDAGKTVAELKGLEDRPWEAVLVRSLPPGTWTVVLELPGEQPRMEKVVLEPESTRRVEFKPQ